MVATTRSKRKPQHLTSGVGWNRERNTLDAPNKWLKKNCKLLSKLQNFGHEGLTIEHEELHKKLSSVNIANDQSTCYASTKASHGPILLDEGEDVDMDVSGELCKEVDESTTFSREKDIQSSRNKRPLPYTNERNTRKCLDVQPPTTTATMKYEFIHVIKVSSVSLTPNVQQVMDMVTTKLGLQSDNPFYDVVALAMRDEQRRMLFNVYESDPLKLHTWLSEMVCRDQMRIGVGECNYIGNLGTVDGLQ